MNKLLVILAVVIASGCVNVDPQSGKVIPRGNQKYKFATVEKKAENLQVGINKTAALILLGSPAETSDDGSVWVYLPERPAVLIPSRALHLRFEGNFLAEYGYRPIILGQSL